MKHLSLLSTLLLTSSMLYAGWISTGMDYRGDCLEMMCDCVEDSETRDGYCCPEGTSFTNTGNSHPTYTPCKCPENQSWDSVSSKCVECLMDYQKVEGACPTPQKPLCINNVCQPCPKETPYWDGKKCVDISCSAYPQAGIADEKTYTETFVGKATDGITDCRCPIGKPFWAANDKKCKSCSEIDATRIYWNKERQKCVECLANYGSGDLGACTNQTKPWCNPDGYTCQACPSGTHWNDTTHTCVLTDCMGNSFKSKDDWSVSLCPRTAIDADYDVYISGSAPYGTISVCGIRIAYRGSKKVPYNLTFNPNTVYATIKKGTSCGIWVYTNWGTYNRYTLDVRYVRKN